MDTKTMSTPPGIPERPSRETSAVTPVPTSTALVRQEHGGALRRGNPGNRGGGRSPNAFRALCRRVVSSTEVFQGVAHIVSDPDHPAFMSAVKWLTDRGYGKTPSEPGNPSPGGGRLLAALPGPLAALPGCPHTDESVSLRVVFVEQAAERAIHDRVISSESGSAG